MEASQNQIVKMNKTFKRILKGLYSSPSITLVGSNVVGGVTPWKTGKTDFSLFLSELLLNLNLVDEVATNINTKSYDFIHDLETLKYWLHRNDKTKLYIFDEANIHLPSRRAMSNKNVDIIQIFPEISKARARLIVIGQDLESIDSELRKTGWVRGRFLKLDLKTVYIIVGNEQYVFRDIPRTNITFDPYEPAPFTLKPTDKQLLGDEELGKLRTWAYDKATWRALGFGHPNEFNRWMRKQVQKLIDRVSTITYTSG